MKRNMELKTVAISILIILMIAFVFPVSAETAGDLQKEEGGVVVNYNYSQIKELTELKNRIILKRDEIQTFEKDVLPRIQWNIPPDIMTMSASGRLEGNFFLAIGDISGKFNAEASAKSEALYKDFDPYVSEEATKEVLLFARKLLEENGTYSLAEQVLALQLEELKSKGINESAEMHIFYVQKLYNSIVDIRNEIDSSVESSNSKAQAEQQNEDARNYDKLSFFEKIKGFLALYSFCFFCSLLIFYAFCKC